jgi:hypothetical protein
LCLVLEYFSTVLISTYEEVGDVLLFVIPFFTFGLKSIFFTQFLPMKAGIEWCAALLWFLSLRLVLRVFFNSPTQFLPMKGLSDVLLFCDSFLYVWS